MVQTKSRRRVNNEKSSKQVWAVSDLGSKSANKMMPIWSWSKNGDLA